MPSNLLYDTRTSEILWCQPHPYGSAYPGNHETLCKSARVSKDEKKYMKVLEIPEYFYTDQAKKMYRIKQEKLYYTPQIIIKSNKEIVKLNDDPTLNVTAIVKYIFDSNDIPEKVEILVNDAEVELRLEDGKFKETLKFVALGKYKIDVLSPNYRHNRFTIEVIE